MLSGNDGILFKPLLGTFFRAFGTIASVSCFTDDKGPEPPTRSASTSSSSKALKPTNLKDEAVVYASE